MQERRLFARMLQQEKEISELKANLSKQLKKRPAGRPPGSGKTKQKTDVAPAVTGVHPKSNGMYDRAVGNHRE